MDAPQPQSCDTLAPADYCVEQAISAILNAVTPVAQSELCPLHALDLRVLCRPLASPINVPAHTNSAMDGYAIRGDDLARPHYRVVANIMAGTVYSSPLAQGEAVQIMTGACLPANADTVIMREQAKLNSDIVTFSTDAIQRGQNVRLAGEDIKREQRVFKSGQRLGAPEIGMLASLGFEQAHVFRRLKVGVFSTGDEVQAPGTPLGAAAIYDANRYVLLSQLKRLGCDVQDLGILEDNQHTIIEALRAAASHCDIVITSGGVSVGDADWVKTALATLGQIEFWRINMRPGRPLAFGQIAGKPFFGLPGNPVAVMVSYLTFVEPAIRKMQGECDWQALKVSAVAEQTLVSRQGRSEFLRGVYHFQADGRLSVRTTGSQGSGILRSMSEANCLIEIAPQVDRINAGESVTIIPLQGRI